MVRVLEIYICSTSFHLINSNYVQIRDSCGTHIFFLLIILFVVYCTLFSEFLLLFSFIFTNKQ